MMRRTATPQPLMVFVAALVASLAASSAPPQAATAPATAEVLGDLAVQKKPEVVAIQLAHDDPPQDAGGDDTTTPQPDEDTTTQPPVEEETTTPPPGPADTASVLQSIVDALKESLHREKTQWVNALVAFIIGLFMIIDGESFFRLLVVGAVFLLASIVGMNEITSLWHLPLESKLRHFVGFEAGLLSAWAAWRGIDGVMLVIGAIIGALIAHAAQRFFVSMGATALATEGVGVVLFYSFFVLLTMALINFKKHMRLLAVISAAAGGALLSSSMSWFTTVRLMKSSPEWLADHGLTPVSGYWSDFLVLLFDSAAPDKGIFANCSYNFTIGSWYIRLDRLIGCTLWLILFLIGFRLQQKNLTKRALKELKAGKRGSPTRGSPRVASARVGVHQPLLMGEEA